LYNHFAIHATVARLFGKTAGSENKGTEMSTLTARHLRELRNAVEPVAPPQYTKAEINAVAQAVENWFEAARPSLNAAINGAYSGLSARQKRAIVKEFLRQKFGRE